MREDGLPQTAAFSIDGALGQVAYQIPDARRIALEPAGPQRRFRLELPPAGGCVVVFLPEEIGAIRIAPPAAEPVAPGTVVKLNARLTSVGHRPVPGVIPAEITITGPDGARHDYSRHSAFVAGQWSMELPIPWNAAPGDYRLHIRDLASGKSERTSFSVAAG